MREKTFEIQGREVFISSEELNEIYRYCFREMIKDNIKLVNEERFEPSIEIDKKTIENIADHIEERLEDVSEIDNWIEEDLEEYYEEMEENK